VLHIQRTHSDFFSYLQKHSTSHQLNSFTFSSSVEAADVIAHFLFYYLKKNRITLIQKQNSFKEFDFSYFNRFICLERSKAIILSITTLVSHHFQQSSLFSLEGFLQFRLKKQTIEIEQLVEEALGFFSSLIPDSSVISFFQTMIQSQDSIEKELSLVVENEQSVWVKGKQKTYFTETTKEEDKLIMHCILMAPEVLSVQDQHHILSHKTIVFLKKIFQEKVTFDETDYFTYSN